MKDRARVLLIEDDPDDALLIKEILTEGHEPLLQVQLVTADKLQSGFERLRDGDIDLILLDLSLPDSQGHDTVIKVCRQAPEVPVIVLTGADDETLAIQAVKSGAQDYLVKGQVDGRLLTRSIRYAIERRRLESELERARLRQQQEVEMSSLKRISGSSSTMTSKLLNVGSLRGSHPDSIRELSQTYGASLDQAVEARAFKTEHNISESLRSVAENLGYLNAGPRDVVDIHASVLKNRTVNAHHQKTLAYVNEGHLVVLELMGYLLSYYRNYSIGVEKAPPAAACASHQSQAATKGDTGQ